MNNKLYLYSHNIESSSKVKEALKNEDIVGIVHATGTGKSYVAIDVILDNLDKKTTYIVPSNAIIEHIKEILKENNLSLEYDFPNLTLRTYQSLINLSRNEIEGLDIDLLILDEFHHIGAPVWGNRINTIIEIHPNIKVFGMTAYTVRDRGTIYERDMANPDGDELFSNKIVSRYDICDAMMEGVLPKPIYKSAYINLLETCNELEKKLDNSKLNENEYKKYKELLNSARKRIHEAPTIKDVIKNNLKKDGKYIYFCPFKSEDGANDINTIMEEAKSWMEYMGLSNDDYEFYITTSKIGEEGKKNRDAFYNDKDINGIDTSKKLKIMFAINQYNEGVHAPGVDGVIMGRDTKSDIVYFEQIGRALSVRGKTKEEFYKLQKLSIEELIELASNKNLTIKENSSKEDIIELLLSPIVIDLANNYEFIKELENNLKNRIKEKQESSNSKEREQIKLLNPSFDIEIENIEIFETLRYVLDRLTLTWENNYELAREYYKKNGNLEIPVMFKTINGIDYDGNGYNLGSWIHNQRTFYKSKKLSQEKAKLLEEIGMRFENKYLTWQDMYKLAEEYYKTHHNLEITDKFKTTNGIDYDENGTKLGRWIRTQREAYKNQSLSEERAKLLEQIDMRFEYKNMIMPWEEKYKLTKMYYEHYGNLEIPQKFKSLNGIDYDENGVKLGNWIATQRLLYANNRLTVNKIKLLEQIGIRWENKNVILPWEDVYKLAKEYYNIYHNLEITDKFKTTNGIDYDENGVKLGKWVKRQRDTYRSNKLSNKKIELLEKIGMIWNVYSNKDKIKEICDNYDIDMEINKVLLEHISYQELQAKINYLLSINENIAKNAKLHEIFSMSSLNMKVEYGITLEELINEYYINEKSKG